MTILFSNNASTTIAGGITAASTTVTLAAGTGVNFPSPINPGDFFVCTFYDQATKTVNEICHCTSRSTDVLTIVRAQEGTTARAWNSGDILANLVTAGTLNAFMQAGAAAANTTVIYVGTDTSTNPAQIIANTTPVPSSYATGMQFNIKVGGSWGQASNSLDGSGHFTVVLNGQPALIARRTDASNLIPGNLITGQEFIFVYNGTDFTTTIPPVPQTPPQTTFYVRADSTSTVSYSTGLETANGLANTPSSAFLTIQGAINTLKSRYISQVALTLRVNDGYYTCGFADNSSYIAGWTVIGNTSNPNNVTIDATSTNPATYVPGASPGLGAVAFGTSAISIQGFTIRSYFSNIMANKGTMSALGSINYTAPTSGGTCIVSAFDGSVALYGNNTYSGTCNAFMECGGGATMGAGTWSIFGQSIFNITLNGAVNEAFAVAETNGYIGIDARGSPPSFSWSGSLTGPQWLITTAGGIGFLSGVHQLPGTIAGTVQSPGWIA